MSGSGAIWPALLAALLLGLPFGSFAAAASWRLPRGMTLWGRSACPSCHVTLTPLDLVPLLSWLAQRGRCRHCGAPIGPRYPLIEAATAVLFALSWLAADGDPSRTAVLSALSTLSVLIVAADLEALMIPDAALLPMLLLGGVWHFLEKDGYAAGLATGLAALILAGALRRGFRALRGFDGLGLGDVKFLGIAGVWLGPAAMAGFLVEAGLLGLLFGLIWRLAGKGAVFPFAPALVASLLAGMLWPPLTLLPLELLS